MDSRGAILLIHRNTSRRNQWEIPGGKVEDESSAAAACREIREELGVVVQAGELLGTCVFTEDDSPMSYSWFRVDIVAGEPHPCEPATHDRCAYFSVRDLAAMPDRELSQSLRLFRRKVLRGTVVL